MKTELAQQLPRKSALTRTHLTQLVFINNAAFPYGDADVPLPRPMADSIMKMRGNIQRASKALVIDATAAQPGLFGTLCSFSLAVDNQVVERSPGWGLNNTQLLSLPVSASLVESFGGDGWGRTQC